MDVVSVSQTAARWRLLSLAFPAMLASMGISMPNVVLPALADYFAAPFPMIQWIVLGYLLSITALVVVVGRLADALGYRVLLLAGLLLYALSALGAALSSSLPWMILMRVIQGGGAAVMMVVSMAAVSLWLPTHQTGKAMGLLASVSALGMALGPVLGGWLADIWQWRALFVCLSVLAGLAAVLVWCVPDTDTAERSSFTWRQFDYLGALLLIFALLALLLASTLPWELWSRLSLYLLALLLLVSFVRIERNVQAPLLRLDLLLQPTIASGAVFNMVVMLVMMTTLVVGPFYLAYGLLLSEASLGAVMSLGPMTVFLSSFIAGYWVDRFSARTVRYSGQLLLLAGCVLFTNVALDQSVLGYVAPLMMTTLGYSLFQTANNSEVLLSVDAQHKGVLSGLLGLSRNLGLVLGASMMSGLFAFYAGVDLTAATALSQQQAQSGLNHVFVVAGVIMLGAFSLGWFVQRFSASNRVELS